MFSLLTYLLTVCAVLYRDKANKRLYKGDGVMTDDRSVKEGVAGDQIERRNGRSGVCIYSKYSLNTL